MWDFFKSKIFKIAPNLPENIASALHLLFLHLNLGNFLEIDQPLMAMGDVEIVAVVDS